MAHRSLLIFRKRLFKILAALSLLLCLASVALWVRSYWRSDNLAHVSRQGEWLHLFEIQSFLGDLYLIDSDLRRPDIVQHMALGWQYPAIITRGIRTDSLFRFLGFSYFDDHGSRFNSISSIRVVRIPQWFLALLFAILPTLRLRSILRTRRRHRAGLCPTCGYDLRATPDRCPECGEDSRDQRSEARGQKEQQATTTDL